MINDIKNFVQGNLNYYFEQAGGEISAEFKEVIETRAAICSGCPFLVKSADKAHCGECGCPFPKLTYAPNKACPIGKWKIHNV